VARAHVVELLLGLHVALHQLVGAPELDLRIVERHLRFGERRLGLGGLRREQLAVDLDQQLAGLDEIARLDVDALDDAGDARPHLDLFGGLDRAGGDHHALDPPALDLGRGRRRRGVPSAGEDEQQCHGGAKAQRGQGRGPRASA
jgi:hypothetical protein